MAVAAVLRLSSGTLAAQSSVSCSLSLEMLTVDDALAPCCNGGSCPALPSAARSLYSANRCDCCCCCTCINPGAFLCCAALSACYTLYSRVRAATLGYSNRGPPTLRSCY